MFPISIMVAPQCLKKQWDPLRKQDHRMNIAPDINNHLRSICIYDMLDILPNLLINLVPQFFFFSPT